MKFKPIISLVLAAYATMASAQSQGYQDGIDYYKAGQHDNALTILNKTLDHPATDRAMAYYYLGQTKLALKNKADAVADFEKGISANPECGYNYVGLGAVDLLNGNPSAADAQFKLAKKYAKKNNEVLVDIARAYYNADPVKYAKEIEKNLSQAYKDSKNQEPAIYIFEGDRKLDLQDVGGAAGQYEMAISFDKANPEGYVKYAKSYFHVNPQFSIQKLEEFLNVAPNSALAQRELAEAYYKANYWKKASDMYGKYITNPNHFPEDKARYSVLLYWSDDFPASLQVANEVLADQPGNFQAQRIRLVDEVKLEQYENAVRHGEEFFASNPGANFTAIDYMSLADAYNGLGLKDKAVEIYTSGIAAFPESAELYSSLSSVFNALASENKSDAPIANKFYRRSAEAFDKYISLTEKPTLQDYYVASGKWLNVAATAGSDIDTRKTASANGVKYVDQVLPTVQESSKPMILERKAFLQTAANEGNKADEAAVATFDELIALIENNPALLDPTNPSNEIRSYKNACSLVVQYYKDVDENKAKLYSEKYRTADALENPQ